jgi:TatA/E family protein of Tat protein translocase
MIPLPSTAFLGGAVGPGEVLVVLAAILILFGPKRLPELARSLGRMLHEFQRASHDFRKQVETLDEPVPSRTPSALDMPPSGPDGGISESNTPKEARPSEPHDAPAENRAG